MSALFKSIAALFLLLCLFPGSARAASPEALTLAAINETLENGDSERFTELVNVDGIINDAITTFAAEAVKPENASKLPPMLALMFSNAVGQENIKALLLQEARAFVLNGVASGAFAGKHLPGNKAQGIFAPLFAAVSLGRKEIRGIGQPMPAGNGSSLITFTIHDWGNDQDYPVAARFVPLAAAGDSKADAGLMRLEAVENLPQIMTQIQQEFSGQ